MFISYPIDFLQNQQPSLEYQRWERNILSTEEIVLEALCFDVTVEQPYVLLRRSIRGVDEILREEEGLAESSLAAASRAKGAEANGGPNSNANRKGKTKLSERSILDASWTLMNQA